MNNAPIPLAKIEINKTKNYPPHQIEITCNHLWSLAQVQAIKRLSTYRREYHLFGTTKWMLEGDFSLRAARIAGTYASFYLEKESFNFIYSFIFFKASIKVSLEILKLLRAFKSCLLLQQPILKKLPSFSLLIFEFSPQQRLLSIKSLYV